MCHYFMIEKWTRRKLITAIGGTALTAPLLDGCKPDIAEFTQNDKEGVLSELYNAGNYTQENLQVLDEAWINGTSTPILLRISNGRGIYANFSKAQEVAGLDDIVNEARPREERPGGFDRGGDRGGFRDRGPRRR